MAGNEHLQPKKSPRVAVDSGSAGLLPMALALVPLVAESSLLCLPPEPLCLPQLLTTKATKSDLQSEMGKGCGPPSRHPSPPLPPFMPQGSLRAAARIEMGPK